MEEPATDEPSDPADEPSDPPLAPGASRREPEASSATDEEPRWRARARIVAMAFFVLALLGQLVEEAPRPATLLGSVAAVFALYLRLPWGVAVLFVSVGLELLETFVTYGALGWPGALGHLAFAVGLSAIAFVLYRRSPDAGLERRATIGGALAMVLGLGTILGTAVVPQLLDPDHELGTIETLRGAAAEYVIALPGEGWRARRREARERAGFDAWAVRTDERGEVRDEIFVTLEMGVPSGAEGIERVTDGMLSLGESREVVDDETGRWLHERFATDRGPEWRSCRVSVARGMGVVCCGLVHGDTTAEHLRTLTDALAAMRWGT